MPQGQGDIARIDSASSTPPTWVISIIGCALVIVAALYTLTGSKMRAEAKALVEQENVAVCAKLGFERGSARHAECAAVLDEVRANEVRRRDRSIL